MSIKVSIIIPVYNTEKYLIQCLESVVNQTLREIEIICVNDGSTDRSLQILEEYAQIDKRIRIFNKKNEGPAVARNEGIEVAKGEYISFIDSDDFISNDTDYEKLYQYAIQNNAEIVSANINIFFDDNSDKKYKSPFITEIHYSSPMLPHDYGNPWYYQKNLFKKHFLLDHHIKFPNYRVGEDPVLLVKALTRVERIYGLSLDFYNYRVSSDNKINTEEKEISYIKHFKEVLEILKLNEFETMVFLYENRMYDFFIKQKFNFESKTLERNIKFIFGEDSNVWANYNLKKDELMNKVKVSIIIPVYNVEKYLTECLDSVVNQTLREIEIICVNDGSNDNSLQILEKYAKKDNRIKIINKENAGLGAARNTGMEYATGEYIGFLDSDDWVDTSMYEKLYENAKSHKSDLVMCPINLYSDTDEEIKHNLSYFSLECFNDGFDNCVFDYKKTKNFIFNIAVTAFNKIYKTKFIRKIDAKFPEGLIFEDNPFFYQTYLNASRVSLIRDPLIFYRVNRPDSIISSADQRWFDVFEIENQNMKFFESLPDYHDYKMELIRGKIFRIITRYFELNEIHKQKFFEILKKDFENMDLTNDEVNNLKWAKKSYLNVANSTSHNDFEKLEKKSNSTGSTSESNEPNSNNLILEDTTPKISIILPVFNVEEYIREALESIQKQTIGNDNLEVIMINDCSTDQSGKIIDEYSYKYKNFKAIHLSENSGNAGKPRNVGIENATGEYLMFLDPDDFYSDDMCKTLYDKIVEKEVDLVFCNFNQYFPNKTLEKSYLPSLGNTDEIILKTIDDHPVLLDMFRLWTIIFKRNFILEKNIKFSEHILSEDRLFLLELFLEARGIVYLQNFYGTNYRVRSHLEKDSLSNSTSKKALMDRIEGYQKVYDVLKNYKKEFLLPYALNVREFWVDRFIKSDLGFSEKKEMLKSIVFLFKEFERFDIEPYKYYLFPVFDDIVEERFDEAVLLADVLKGFINEQEQLQQKLLQMENNDFCERGMKSDKLNEFGLVIEGLKDHNRYLENLVKEYRSRKVVKVADAILKIYNVLKMYFKKFLNDKTNIPNENEINLAQSIKGCVDFENVRLRSTNNVELSDKAKNIKDIKVAVIFDEFSYKCFKHEFNVIPIEPLNWLNKFENENPDIFLCESAWHGIDTEKEPWKGIISVEDNVTTENKDVLNNILKYCSENGIPSIFWNKEDPTDFDTFLDTALKFDHIFTTTEECIPKYKEHGHTSVHCLMFAGQPKLFNPIENQKRSEDIVFAGSWYNRFPQRCNEMEGIFDNIISNGFKLKIYDRFYHSIYPAFDFPDKYNEFINPAVPFNQIEKVYKESQYSLSINTITKSNSMFSRRVFELMLCNTLVLSNYSEGICRFFGNNVVLVDKDKKIDLSDADEKRIFNLYNVLRNHTYYNRFKKILDKINYEYIPDDKSVTVNYVINDQSEFESVFEHFNLIQYNNKRLRILLSKQIHDTTIDKVYQNYGNYDVSFYSLKDLQNKNKVISNETTYFIFANLKLKDDFIEKAVLHYSYIKPIFGISLGDKFAFETTNDITNIIFHKDNFTNVLKRVLKEDSGDFSVYTIQI